jgi:hypothetical protein
LDLEDVARQFQDAIICVYKDSLTVRRNNRNVSWWNRNLAEKRRNVRSLFHAAKSGNWTDYKRYLTDYNKSLRQAKKESWRRHCKEIEKVPVSDRLHKIISQGGRVLLFPLGWIMVIIPHQRRRHCRNYCGCIFLVLK